MCDEQADKQVGTERKAPSPSPPSPRTSGTSSSSNIILHRFSRRRHILFSSASILSCWHSSRYFSATSSAARRSSVACLWSVASPSSHCRSWAASDPRSDSREGVALGRCWDDSTAPGCCREDSRGGVAVCIPLLSTVTLDKCGHLAEGWVWSVHVIQEPLPLLPTVLGGWEGPLPSTGCSAVLLEGSLA